MKEPSQGLTDRLRALCAEASAALQPGPFADAVDAIARRLADGGLVVASAGSSTRASRRW